MASTENTSQSKMEHFASSSENEEESSCSNPKTFQVSYKLHQGLIQDTFNKALFTGAYSDILLVCGEEQFKCHKLVLGSVSKQFETLFANLGCSSQVIMIYGIRPKILKGIIEFMYRGTVSISSEDIGDFIKAGEDMKIKGLIKNMQDDPPPSQTKERIATSVEDFLATEIDDAEGLINDGDSSSRTMTAASDLSICDEGVIMQQATIFILLFPSIFESIYL